MSSTSFGPSVTMCLRDCAPTSSPGCRPGPGVPAVGAEGGPAEASGTRWACFRLTGDQVRFLTRLTSAPCSSGPRPHRDGQPPPPPNPPTPQVVGNEGAEGPPASPGAGEGRPNPGPHEGGPQASRRPRPWTAPCPLPSVAAHRVHTAPRPGTGRGTRLVRPWLSRRGLATQGFPNRGGAGRAGGAASPRRPPNPRLRSRSSPDPSLTDRCALGPSASRPAAWVGGSPAL